MGQAKQRGTREQRQQAAIEAAKIALLDNGSADRKNRIRQVDRLEQAMLRGAAEQRLDDAVTRPYSVLLHYMFEHNLRGACHSTSAVLFVLMSELGLEPTLCIGEVCAGGTYFDHSWVEFNGKVFDVAVCLPDPRGAEVGGPIFASVSLDTGAASTINFAYYREGLGADALASFNNTLDGYAQVQRTESGAGPDIWQTIAFLAPQIGLTCTVPDLIAKYGAVRREYRRGGEVK